MKRQIDRFLNSWKSEKNRKPLLVRGARQVGKSYSISEFGKKKFDQYVEINFESDIKSRSAFETLNPSEIIQTLSIITNQNIVPGKCLLFLDEIQAFPKAITSLRYFYEKLPELHIIAAGSLLELALESAGISFPVGRLQYIYMKPMTYYEFLTASGFTQMCDFLDTFEGGPVNLAVHNKFLDTLKTYLLIGGMPEAVSSYLEENNYHKCRLIQSSILETYYDDFNKYSRYSLHESMQKVFQSVPRQIGSKFKYSKVDSEAKSASLKAGLVSMQKANIFHQIFHARGDGLPLGASIKSNFFKVIMMDTGLMQNSCGIDSEIVQEKDLINVYRGALMEQFVGQELIGYQNPFIKPQLFAWGREAKNSNAEVDYLWQCNGSIYPVEVKSGTTGQLKSLQIFLKEKGREWGIKISSSQFKVEKPVLSIPFYLLSQMSRLVEKYLI